MCTDGLIPLTVLLPNTLPYFSISALQYLKILSFVSAELRLTIYSIPVVLTPFSIVLNAVFLVIYNLSGAILLSYR